MSIFQSLSRLPWPQWAVGLAAFQALIICALEAVLLTEVKVYIDLAFADDKGRLPFIMVYFALFMLAMVFQAVLTYEASIHKNTMQTVATAAFGIACFGYSIVQNRQLSPIRRCATKYIHWWDTTSFASSAEDATKNYYSDYLWNLELICQTPWGGPSDGEGTDTTRAWNSRTQDWETVKIARDIRLSVEHVRGALTHMDTAMMISFVIIGLMAVTAAISCFLAYKVYREYGWRIFQEQGASIQKKRILRRFHLFILFLKLNIYFSIGIVAQIVTAQYFSKVDQRDECALSETQSLSCKFRKVDQEPFKFIVLPSLIVLGIVAITYYAFGWYAIKHTHRPSMYAFIAVIAANICAMVYVLIMAQDEAMEVTRIWLTSFAVVQLLLNLLLAGNAVLCLRDFDRGLTTMVQVNRGKGQEMAQTNPRPLVLD